MKVIYISVGLISLAIGILGVVLPVLPTTPFLLLTLYLFAKGSPKFHNWFVNTRLYRKYLKTFAEERAMTFKQKWRLMIFVDVVIILTIILVNHPVVTISLVFIDVLKYIYFFTQVKTIKEI